MNFQNQIDYLPSMFDDINLPEELNHELVVSSIVKRCGLLTPVYSEPALMKDAIDLWFNANQWTLQHLIKIIEAEYSPIENTDRYDEQTRTIDRELDRDDTFNETNTTARNSTDTLVKTGTETTKIDSDTTVDADNEKTEQVSPYDSSNWANSSKSIEDNGSTATVDGTNRITYNTSDARTLGGSDTQTHGGTNGRDEDENTTDHFVQHLHGNIGVTSNQDMINQEIALLEKFHVYDWIALQIEADLFIILY